MTEALRLLDELIEHMRKIWPNSAEVANLEAVQRDLMAEAFLHESWKPA